MAPGGGFCGLGTGNHKPLKQTPTGYGKRGVKNSQSFDMLKILR